MNWLSHLPYILFGLFILLSIGDIITTYTAIDSGKGTESNPIMRTVMSAIGVVPALILTKAIISGILLVVIVYYPSKILDIVLGLLCVFYIWVVLNNKKIL